MAVHLNKGAKAEQLALYYLQRQGFKLIEKNWRCDFGEIDLIMETSDVLVFVEVRYRAQITRGTPAETIVTKKQQKILRTASLFLQKNARWSKMPCRFDVISMTGSLNDPIIEWITEAFNAQS